MQALHHLDKGDTFDVDVTVADADVSAFDGLVLPGGVANPDALRADEGAVSFARAFFDGLQRQARRGLRTAGVSTPVRLG